MVIQGIGTDIIEIRRIERLIKKWGDKFLNRVFCDGEVSYAKSRKAFFCSSLAARYAAKEAVLKALGTGLSKGSWLDIEITSLNGCPRVILKGKTKALADLRQVKCFHLSLSHCGDYAVAFAVAEGRVDNETGDS